MIVGFILLDLEQLDYGEYFKLTVDFCFDRSRSLVQTVMECHPPSLSKYKTIPVVDRVRKTVVPVVDRVRKKDSGSSGGQG